MRLFINSLTSQEEEDIVVNPTTEVYTSNEWIITQRDNYRIRISANTIEVSDNGGLSYTSSMTTAVANTVITAKILTNGNVLFITDQNDQAIYLSDVRLSKLVKKEVYDTDGSIYVPPLETSFRYSPLEWAPNTEETDLLVWGNYSNLDYEPTPINIFYTDDFGETINISYSFDEEGIDVRHVHCVYYNKYDNTFYLCTGDFVIDENTSQIQWMKGVYNGSGIDWTYIDFGWDSNPRSRIKCIGVFFRNIEGVNYIYWGSDSTDSNLAEMGVWRCKLSEFNDISKQEQIFAVTEPYNYVNGMTVNHETGLVVVMLEEYYRETHTIAIIKDFGHGEGQIHEFNDILPYSAALWFPDQLPDLEQGYIRFSTVWREPNQTYTFYIKPGDDLFNNINA